jgi:stringent starvation protein B
LPELSRRPYLLRAMLDWIVDCGHAPHLIVDASIEAVRVPRQFVKEGRIVLNISASATQSFRITAEAVEFQARFSGVSHQVYVPVDQVLGIYARETGQGMVFTDEQGAVPATAGTGSSSDEPSPPSGPDKPRKPNLKVVK